MGDACNARLQAYRELEQRIRKDDLSGLLARWAFGRELLREREANGGEKLPDGRLTELANALAISRTELKNRMQFAAEHPTEEAVRALGVSWYEVCRSRLGTRTKSPTKPDVTSGASREEDDPFDAFRVPVRLRGRLQAATDAALAAGRAVGSNHPGEQGVEALLEFVEGEGRVAWGEWLGRPDELGVAA